jgi:hypothetical protein
MGIADAKLKISEIYANQGKYNEGISSANDVFILLESSFTIDKSEISESIFA